MDQDKLNVVLNAVASLFMPIIEQRLKDSIKTMVDDAIQVKIDDLTSMDKAFITDVVRSEIENADVDQQISDWMESNFDNLIEFYIDDHLDLKDKIDDYLSDRLSDLVKDEVRDLSFSVTVD